VPGCHGREGRVGHHAVVQPYIEHEPLEQEGVGGAADRCPGSFPPNIFSRIRRDYGGRGSVLVGGVAGNSLTAIYETY
jgi:hypothetical protein